VYIYIPTITRVTLHTHSSEKAEGNSRGGASKKQKKGKRGFGQGKAGESEQKQAKVDLHSTLKKFGRCVCVCVCVCDREGVGGWLLPWHLYAHLSTYSLSCTLS
jgi:hypothetical protein